jgi:hypothetical protein
MGGWVEGWLTFQLGLKRKEVAKSCRIMHNEELYNLYASSNIVG